MQNRTLKNLEYNKIISLLSSNCVTYIGKEIAEKLLPSNNIETVQMLQTETKEACSFSLRKNSVPLSPIANLENIINKLNVGDVWTHEFSNDEFKNKNICKFRVISVLN